MLLSDPVVSVAHVLTDTDRGLVAAALAGAERDRAPVPPVSQTWPGMTVEDAYAVQLLGVSQQRAAGRRVVGHKVGLTSLVMQQMLGVDQPDYGQLLDHMVHTGPVALDHAALIAPRVEVEVAFVLGSHLEGPDVTAAQVRAATAAVLPSLEVIDSRVKDWRITLVDTVADNASCGAVVLGEQRTPIDQVDLPRVAASMRINGTEVASGTADAVLGDPAEAVAWLARTLAAVGGRLEAGQVIMPGSCTKAVDVVPGDHVEAELTGLGSVSCTFR